METNNTLPLDEITRIAAAGYTPKQTAFMLGLKPAEFEALLQDENSDASIAYFKGYFSSELKVRESIITLARNGSGPAQAQSLKLFDDLKRQLTRDGYQAFSND